MFEKKAVKTRKGLALQIKGIGKKDAEQIQKAILNIESNSLLRLGIRGKISKLHISDSDGYDVYSYRATKRYRVIFAKREDETKIVSVADIHNKGNIKIF